MAERQRQAEIYRQLKELAKKFKVVVVTAHQVPRPNRMPPLRRDPINPEIYILDYP